jgi:hypothetical protein
MFFKGAYFPTGIFTDAATMVYTLAGSVELMIFGHGSNARGSRNSMLFNTLSVSRNGN